MAEFRTDTIFILFSWCEEDLECEVVHEDGGTPSTRWLASYDPLSWRVWCRDVFEVGHSNWVFAW